MKTGIILKWLPFIALFIAGPISSMANDGKPAKEIAFSYTMARTILSDTLPAPVKTPENSGDKPVEDIIKGVPKSKKQVVPVPVTVQVKPIKIIKPVIKVLH